MNLILYVTIFIIGIFFGSFFTLAVYRIPKKEDILIKHSYCPNCNHKLGFFDLFPVFSYMLLRGKCRYCGNKIRPRYLILELLSGLTFIIIAFSLKITVDNINLIIYLAMLLLYVSILFIIAGIDKENNETHKGVLVVGFIMEITYIIYQCTFLNNINVYQYVMYLIFLILILMLSIISLKVTKEDKYYIQILYLLLYIIVFGGSRIFILTSILSMIIIALYSIVNKNIKKEIPIGFFLCISNIVVIVISNILINYVV